jgi:hypothetical protein
VFNFSQKELATKAYEIDKKNEFSNLRVSRLKLISAGFFTNCLCIYCFLCRHVTYFIMNMILTLNQLTAVELIYEVK